MRSLPLGQVLVQPLELFLVGEGDLQRAARPLAVDVDAGAEGKAELLIPDQLAC